ncbi:ABC transporter permease [Haloarcula marina]|uniref:ABC transporter permease n=1 Tax=Haloarcula marina TaxID=2961574 RepID=UPI0020B780ED|nr:ABC transporter permease [Halomicroarcula marina]
MSNISDFLVRRAVQAVGVIWGIVTLVFLLRFLSPQDPASLVAPQDADSELIEAIRQDLGLDEPIIFQYRDYLLELVQGSLGYSYASKVQVNDLVVNALPATLELAFASLIFAVALSVPLGLISAKRRGSGVDSMSNSVSLIGLSTPNFWLGIMLILLLAVQFNIFPTSGRVSPTESLSQWAAHMVLPTVTLGTYFMALIFRMTRNNIIEELNKEYVRAARAKGLPENIVTLRYVMQNSMAPVITVAGLQLGVLIGGSVVVEAVFNWPGLGTLFVSALQSQDWPIMQGILIVVGIGYVSINILVDLINSRLDPRVNLA